MYFPRRSNTVLHTSKRVDLAPEIINEKNKILILMSPKVNNSCIDFPQIVLHLNTDQYKKRLSENQSVGTVVSSSLHPIDLCLWTRT